MLMSGKGTLVCAEVRPSGLLGSSLMWISSHFLKFPSFERAKDQGRESTLYLHLR